MDQSDHFVGVDYILLYHLTSLLMHAIGPKVWIKQRHNPHFLFPRLATRSKPRMPGWYKLDRL